MLSYIFQILLSLPLLIEKKKIYIYIHWLAFLYGKKQIKIKKIEKLNIKKKQTKPLLLLLLLLLLLSWLLLFTLFLIQYDRYAIFTLSISVSLYKIYMVIFRNFHIYVYI